MKKPDIRQWIKKPDLASIVKRERVPDIKRTLKNLLPYGKFIEKVYLSILVLVFVILIAKTGNIPPVSYEGKVLIMAVGIGGLFILRSLRNKVYFPKTYTVLISLFLVFSIITTIFSVNVYNSMLRLMELFAALLLGVLAYDIVYGKYSRRWLLNTLTTVVVISLLYGIVRYVFPIDATSRTSLIYPLGFPVYMGGMILAFLPYTLSSTLKTRGMRRNLFLIASLILLLSLWLTFSQIIYVIGLIEIAVFLYINLFTGRRPLRKDRFYIPLLGVVVVAVILGFVMHFPTSGTIPYTPSSISDRTISPAFRVDLYQQAWHSFATSPLVGTGLGNFKITSVYYLSNPWHLSYYLYNDIFEMFVSEGFIGGFLFVAIFGYILYEIFRKENRIKIFMKQNPETFELTIGILALIVLALFYPILNVETLLFTLFLFVGMLLKDLRIDNFKRFYFGNLSLGAFNGLSVFLVLLTLYFFIINNWYVGVRDAYSSTSNSQLSTIQQPVEKIVQFNPLDTEYSAVLSQIYISANQYDKAMNMDKQALKYNSKSPYLIYTQALLNYLKGNSAEAKTQVDALIKNAPYADPSFYLLLLQIDQNNTPLFTSELKTVAKRFAITDDYYRYQNMFTDLGYADSLSKIYVELALVTKDNSYFSTAQKINPQGFSLK